MKTTPNDRKAAAKQMELPPLTADAVDLLHKGGWLVNIHHTLYCSMMADAVVVTPVGVPSAVAINESALMPLEDWIHDYAAQRWVELPKPG